MWRTKVIAVLTLALLASLLSVGLALAKPQKEPAEIRGTAELRKAVGPAGILVHERRFQRFANADPGGTRASGNEGYDASSVYVADKLEAADYDVTIQPFEFPYFDVLSESFSQTAPQQRDFEPYNLSTGEGDYDIMTYSGSGTFEDALVVPTNDVEIPPNPDPPPNSDSGCEPTDFERADDDVPDLPEVALIQRGTCDFVVKARNAEAAGYDAAIIFNEGQPGRTDVVLGNLGEPDVNIPVVGISFALGQELYEADEARVSMDIQTESEIRETTNVIADTPTGREDRTT